MLTLNCRAVKHMQTCVADCATQLVEYVAAVWPDYIYCTTRQRSQGAKASEVMNQGLYYPAVDVGSLAQLYVQMRLEEAVYAMCHWDSAKLQAEISMAFVHVPWAPSAFLQCVNWYSHQPGNNVSFITQWIEVAVACIKATSFAQIPRTDSWLAGSMLPALWDAPMQLVADFALAFRVDPHALTTFCSHLLNDRVHHAVQLMNCLKMKQLLPVEAVLSAVVRQKEFTAGDVYVKGDQEHQRMFVQMLIDYKVHDKVVKRRLSMFELDAKDFPVYFERQQKATLRFLIYSKEYEQALKFAESSLGLKFAACQTIIQHAGVTDPATKQFVFRTGLTQNFPEVDVSEEQDKDFQNKDDLAALDTCLSLVDVIGEANIVFVDTLTALQNCADFLMKQPVIGFDAEWKAIHIPAGPGDVRAPCALVQLASREKAFVVDVLALSDHGHVLAPLFQSDTVIKLGFDTEGDVKVLRPFLTKDVVAKSIMSMLVDLQAVERGLRATEGPIDNNQSDGDNSSLGSRVNKPPKMGLTTIAEAYLGLPIDKRVRMSNWERRPLTRAQFHYAALDAHVLVQIYNKMQEQRPESKFQAIMQLYTHKYVE